MTFSYRFHDVLSHYLFQEHHTDESLLHESKSVLRSSIGGREWDAWEEEIVIDEDEVIPKDEIPELIIEFYNVDKRVPTIFDRARMENGNTEEKKYILSLHKIHAEVFSEADLEEKMNRWVYKEFKNLMKTHDCQFNIGKIHGIREYTSKIKEKSETIQKTISPITRLQKFKDEKWVMYLVEIVKFCDATLEKVLNEVKLRIFQNQFWKKLPQIANEKVGIFCEWKTNSADDEASIIINL
ncbi:hypothetical protein Tco_0173988 [Tanacetum coccineum]